MVYDDPCHLAWQVTEIRWLESLGSNSKRPLPARPVPTYVGKSDSAAQDSQRRSDCSIAWVPKNLIHRPREVEGV